MLEIEHLLFVGTWLILYLILQLCTWVILRAWLSAPLALPASFAVNLLLSCLISWYLAWLGFSPTSTLGIFLVLTGIVFGTIEKARIGILSDLKDGKWYYALFFIVFFTMLIVRMFNSQIIEGSDNFFNYAFFTSIMQTPVVPPLDLWFAGETLAIYYHLGHWCFATLGMNAHLPSWIVFQFVMPTVFSVSAVQLYGIGKLLLRKFSILPAILLFIANPAFIYFYLIGIEHYALFGASTRVIPATINEYPLFTYLLGVVHAYAMAIFNQAFFILMIVYLFTQWPKLINSERIVCAILAGISLGTMVGMNVWNAFASAPLFLLAALVIWYQTHSSEEGEERSGIGTWFSKVIVHLCNNISDLLKRREISHSSGAILYLWVLVPAIAFLSYAPYFLMMDGKLAQGIGVVYSKTTLPEFFLIFGWFLILLVCTLYSDIKKQPLLLFIVVPFAVVGYPFIGLIFVLLAYLIARHEGVSDFLFAGGLLLVLFCEFFYIMDVATNGTQWYRMNTVFKIYFSVWFFLGIGALCSASIRAEQFMDRICQKEKGAIIEKCIPKLVAVGVLVLILTVPILNNELASRSYVEGLDGFSWMKTVHSNDYAAAMYVHELPGEHVLVEAEGSTRISTLAGVPTILGLMNVEALWRGLDKVDERTTDIAIIYEHPERALEIMEKYHADLLVLGTPERVRYQIPDDTSAYFADLVPVFISGETTVYQRIQE